MDVEQRNRLEWEDVEVENSNPWSRVVGAAIEAARKGAGMSAVELSTRTADYGHRVHRVAISKIEAGARDITLPELAAIAGALDIAPTALLFPNVLEQLEVLPGLRVIGTEALGWFTGLGNGRPGHCVDGASGDDLGLQWHTVPSRIVPEAIRLVEVEEALKYQRNVVDILEGETELPTESEIRKTVRAERIAHARKILELLKDEWHMRVYDELLRLTGSPRTPPSLVGPLEERLEELTSDGDNEDA